MMRARHLWRPSAPTCAVPLKRPSARRRARQRKPRAARPAPRLRLRKCRRACSRRRSSTWCRYVFGMLVAVLAWVATHPEAAHMQDFQDTHQHTDVTEPLAAIDDMVAMSRRSVVPKQVIIMGLFGTDRDRDAINQLLPKLLEASVLDRPTVRASKTRVACLHGRRSSTRSLAL